MSTYLIAYEEALTQKIETGGTVEEIDQVVQAYNVFRRPAFDAWLASAALTCSRCDAPASVDQIEPLDEVTCATHRRSVTGAA